MKKGARISLHKKMKKGAKFKAPKATPLHEGSRKSYADLIGEVSRKKKAGTL